jgi:hypothetical protein
MPYQMETRPATKIERGDVLRLIETHHYAHSLPPHQYCFAAIIQRVQHHQVTSEQVVGGALYGMGVNPHAGSPFGLPNTDVIELVRFFLLDDVSSYIHNAGSQVLSATLKWLTKHTNKHLVVSYSDPQQAHVGTLYQATNWVYLGTSAEKYDIILDGQRMQQRSLYGKFGGSSVELLKECLGERIDTIPTPGKHKYAYVISSNKQVRKQLESALRKTRQQYPKKKGRSK